MPLYLISHAVDLTTQQQDQIAEKITGLHTNLFTTPSLFVNVRFSPAEQYRGYVGGKRSQVNTIQAHVRHGPSRTLVMYEELTSSLNKLWGEVVEHSPDVRIFIMGDIVAGFEHGVALPPAGGDKVWLKNNMPVFERKAKEGNEEMKELLEEVKRRGLVEDNPVHAMIVDKNEPSPEKE